MGYQLKSVAQLLGEPDPVAPHARLVRVEARYLASLVSMLEDPTDVSTTEHMLYDMLWSFAGAVLRNAGESDREGRA